MTQEERIENIKILLSFCPISTVDVEIVEEKVGLFFANLFNNDDRFQHTPYARVYPRIYLYEALNADYKTHSTSIGIEYTYDNDRDGHYTQSYVFNDEDLKDACAPHLHGSSLEYSDVPDNIWEIIQNVVYKKAVFTINKGLENAEKSVIYWKNKLTEFSDLKLNKN